MEDLHRDDVDTGAITYFLIALAIGCLIVFVIVFEIYWYLDRNVHSHDTAPLPIVAELFPRERDLDAKPEDRRKPPGPQLRPSPPMDLKEFRESEMPHLTSYEWVDKAAGRVRIPIERAIDLTAERQIPSRPQPAAERTAP